MYFMIMMNLMKLLEMRNTKIDLMNIKRLLY